MRVKCDEIILAIASGKDGLFPLPQQSIVSHSGKCSMNLNPLPWLRGTLIRSEIGKWTAAGIIQTDQEQRICQQYDQACCGIAVGDFARLTLFALSATAMMLALVLVATDL